jgi:two-component system LytT family response regulator
MRVLIADDEAPARRRVRDLLAAEPDVEVAAEAADGREAVELIRSQRPDLVFLDVQMPRLDGFGVIAAIGVEAMPRVVFVTAYDEHALRAFEVHAFDYLLKPFAPARLRRVVARARAELERGAPAAELVERLAGLLAAASGGPAYLRQVLVERAPGREALLAVEAIDVVRAEGNYLRFVTATGEYLRRGTLVELEQRLDPERFLRLNRSEIVRLEAVAELQPWFHGDYRVRLESGALLTWSRRYRARAKGRFEPG